MSVNKCHKYDCDLVAAGRYLTHDFCIEHLREIDRQPAETDARFRCSEWKCDGNGIYVVDDRRYCAEHLPFMGKPENGPVEPDPVQLPSHYRFGKIEVWDFIVDQQLDFCLGNVIKYVARHRHKGKPLEDLKKARQYLNKAIEQLETQ